MDCEARGNRTASATARRLGAAPTIAPHSMARVLLVYPEFRSASFWNYRETCELVGARYPAAPLGLCTIAAMLPPEWDVRLVDRNIETWDDSMLDTVDIVFTGGMMPQQR